MLAVELILGLVEARAADDPVPVRLSAASWDTSHPVEAWLTEHLVQTYQLPPASAAALVAARMVLPVVDGLDEMDPDPQPGYDSRAAQALRALNAYQGDRAKADVVLTCRSGQYQALEAVRVWAEDAAHVQIEPVPSGKAHEFIHRRVNDPGRWQKVLDTIDNEPAGALARGLSTPWRLTLAVTIYEHRDPRNGAYLREPNRLVDPSLDSPDAVRDHLLELFIPAATASQQATAPADGPNQVRTWLTTLATYLNDNTTTSRTLGGRPLSGTDIVLHELWPLAGTRRPRAVTLAVLGAAWLIATPPLLLMAGVGFAPRQIVGAGGAAVVLIGFAYSMWANIWPAPIRADLNLRSRSSRRRLAGGLAVGLATGLATGLAVGLAAGLAAGLTYGLANAVANAVAVGLAVGLAGGLAGFRYVALLLCTRKRTPRWLPWRLGAFLEWCYTAGLTRKAGIAYQFRHRELQDYLARHRAT